MRILLRVLFIYWPTLYVHRFSQWLLLRAVLFELRMRRTVERHREEFDRER
jgi:hypothetical protein